MGNKTSIEWTRGDDGSLGATWNPTRGCTRVSEGCRSCYAERIAARMSKPGMWGHAFAAATPAGPRWTGVVRLIPEALDLPLRWKRPRRIFVNSTSDLFHESLPDDAIDHVFAVMSLAGQHTFQILTKRPARMRKYVTSDRMGYIEGRAKRIFRERSGDPTKPVLVGKTLVGTWPWPNVWLGVSVEDQATADERIPLLLGTPAAVRFISLEPQLSFVDLFPWLSGGEGFSLGWVIQGGESGPGARPFSLHWARSVRDQCRVAGTPYFLKQLGRWITMPEGVDLKRPYGCWPDRYLLPDGRTFLPGVIGNHTHDGAYGAIAFGFSDPKGGDPARWPDDLNVREFPA